MVNGTCACAYPSSIPDQCQVLGTDVLNYLDMNNVSYGTWCAIMISINVIYRIAYVFNL